MRKSRFTESQIVGILKDGEEGVPLVDLVRKHGLSRATGFNWRSKIRGHDRRRPQTDEGARGREREAETAFRLPAVF